MFTGARERVAFWWESCGPLWKVAGMIYAIFGALTLYRDNFMSPEAQKRYATMTLLPKIAWSYWVLALVVIFVGAILEGTFRAYKRSGSPSQPLDPFLPADPLNVLNLHDEWHTLGDRFEDGYHPQAYAMWEKYDDDPRLFWTITGCGDTLKNQSLLVLNEEAGNLLLRTPYFVNTFPDIAKERDAGDRWLLALSKLTNAPRKQTGMGVEHGRHSISGEIKKLPAVSSLACKQLAAKETATFASPPTAISQSPARIEITNLTRRVWPLERHGFTGAEYYIDIFNGSDTESLEGACVELVALSPDVIGFLPVPLHIKHDDYETREFSINPRSIRQIDILTGPINHPRSQKEMIIPHTVNRERFPLPRDNYRMTIRASARNATPEEAVFDAWIDRDSELRCVRVRVP